MPVRDGQSIDSVVQQSIAICEAANAVISWFSLRQLKIDQWRNRKWIIGSNLKNIFTIEFPRVRRGKQSSVAFRVEIRQGTVLVPLPL